MTTHNLVAMGRILGQWESGLEAFQIDLAEPWGEGHVLSYSMFPYTVPEGKILRVRSMQMTLKFPYDFNTHRTCYFIMDFGWTIAAHHPEVHFDPPFDLPAGTVLSGSIMNGMQETQNMSVMVGAELLDG